MSDDAGAGSDKYTGQGASDGAEVAEAAGARVEPADDEALGSGRLDGDMDARPCSRLSDRKLSVVKMTCAAFHTFNVIVGFNRTSKRAEAVLMFTTGVTSLHEGDHVFLTLRLGRALVTPDELISPPMLTPVTDALAPNCTRPETAADTDAAPRSSPPN